MKRDHGGSGFALLKELPIVGRQLYQEAVHTNGLRIARRFSVLAARQPEHMAELTRGMTGSNYAVQALVLNSLLMSMSVRCKAADSSFGAFKVAGEIAQGVNRLYLPVTTQRPDLGLAITSAALAEPDIPVVARDQVAVAFANASFSLLRSRPQPTLALLQTLARRSAEQEGHYISGRARGQMVKDLTALCERYPPHFGAQPLRGLTGGAVSLPAATLLEVMGVISDLSHDREVKKTMQARSQQLQARMVRFEKSA